MRLPLCFIAGPFRGPTPLDVRRNVERARDLGLRVAKAGGYPIIPHTMTCDFDKQLDDEFWLDGTLALLARCDAIVCTTNYTQSTGARDERQWAEDHGMPIWIDYGEDDVLREFVQAVRVGRGLTGWRQEALRLAEIVLNRPAAG